MPSWSAGPLGIEVYGANALADQNRWTWEVTAEGDCGHYQNHMLAQGTEDTIELAEAAALAWCRAFAAGILAAVSNVIRGR